MTMATSTQQQDRAAVTDAEARALLAEWNTRGALDRVWNALRAEAAALRRSDPARAALLDASLAGSLAALAAAHATSQPRKPPGYRGGPPSAEHLLSAYETARTETSRQR
jgi:hypothetical protein